MGERSRKLTGLDPEEEEGSVGRVGWQEAGHRVL